MFWCDPHHSRGHGSATEISFQPTRLCQTLNLLCTVFIHKYHKILIPLWLIINNTEVAYAYLSPYHYVFTSNHLVPSSLTIQQAFTTYTIKKDIIIWTAHSNVDKQYCIKRLNICMVSHQHPYGKVHAHCTVLFIGSIGICSLGDNNQSILPPDDYAKRRDYSFSCLILEGRIASFLYV